MYRKPHGRQELENAYQELVTGIHINGSFIQLKPGLGKLNIGSNVTYVIKHLVNVNDCYYLHAVHFHHPHTVNRPEHAYLAAHSGCIWSLRALADTGSDLTRHHRGGRSSDLIDPDIPPALLAAATAPDPLLSVFTLLSAYGVIARTHFTFIRAAMFRLAGRASADPSIRKVCISAMALIEQDILSSDSPFLLRQALCRRGEVLSCRRGTSAPFPMTDLDSVLENDDVEVLVMLLDMGMDVRNIYGVNGGSDLCARHGALGCLLELARRGIDVSARRTLLDHLYRPLLVEIALLDILCYVLEAIPHVLYGCAMWLVVETPRRAALVRSDDDSRCVEFIDAWIAAKRRGTLKTQQDCELFVNTWT